jgi:iron(III) transport system substrate-binding protein
MSIVRARATSPSQEILRLGARPRALLESAGKQFRCLPTRRRRSAGRQFADIKLIDYDQARYGKSAERKRLIARWDAEVGALPKP